MSKPDNNPSQRDRIHELYQSVFGAPITPMLGPILALNNLAVHYFMTEDNSDDAQFVRGMLKYVSTHGCLPD